MLGFGLGVPLGVDARYTVTVVKRGSPQHHHHSIITTTQEGPSHGPATLVKQTQTVKLTQTKERKKNYYKQTPVGGAWESRKHEKGSKSSNFKNKKKPERLQDEGHEQ
jgi:hypothetical protein